MENYDVAALGKELYAINSSDKFLKEIYSNSKIVDLKEVGDMLVKVQEQIESISKSKGLVKSVIEKIPLIGKLSKKRRPRGSATAKFNRLYNLYARKIRG